MSEQPLLPAKLTGILSQVSMTPDRQIALVEDVKHLFIQLADWHTRILALEITGPDDDEGMNKAKEGVEFLKAFRIKSLKFLKSRRETIAERMADDVAEDKAYLKATQTFESDMKYLEGICKEKAETRIRAEAAERERLRVTRHAQIANLTPSPEYWPLDKMDEGDFQNLLTVLTKQKAENDRIEQKMRDIEAAQEQAEKDAEEATKKMNDFLTRKANRVRRLMALGMKYVEATNEGEVSGSFYLSNGYTVHESGVATIEDDEFELVYQESAREKALIDEAARKEAEQEKQRQDLRNTRTKVLVGKGMSFDGEVFTYDHVKTKAPDILDETENAFQTYVETLEEIVQEKLEKAQEKQQELIDELIEQQWHDKQKELDEAKQKELTSLDQPYPDGEDVMFYPIPSAEELVPTHPPKGTVKERLDAWVNSFQIPAFPGDPGKEGAQHVSDIVEAHEAFKLWCLGQIETLETPKLELKPKADKPKATRKKKTE